MNTKLACSTGTAVVTFVFLIVLPLVRPMNRCNNRIHEKRILLTVEGKRSAVRKYLCMLPARCRRHVSGIYRRDQELLAE